MSRCLQQKREREKGGGRWRDRWSERWRVKEGEGGGGRAGEGAGREKDGMLHQRASASSYKHKFLVY